eukprot:9306374-Lingulodinium_polyedra.AAC.3
MRCAQPGCDGLPRVDAGPGGSDDGEVGRGETTPTPTRLNLGSAEYSPPEPSVATENLPLAERQWQRVRESRWP